MTSNLAPEETQKKKSSKLGKLLLGFVLLTLLLYMILQVALNSFIHNKLQTTYGEYVRYDSIKLGILRGQLTIENLSIGDPTQEESILTIDHFRAKGMWATLVSRRPTITELDVGDVALNVELTDEITNIDLLKEQLEALKENHQDQENESEKPDQESESEEEKEDAPTIIEWLKINNLRVRLRNTEDDKVAESTFDFSGLTGNNLGSEDGSLSRLEIAAVEIQANRKPLLKTAMILLESSTLKDSHREVQTIQNLEILSPEMTLIFDQDGDTNLDQVTDLLDDLFEDDEEDEDEDQDQQGDENDEESPEDELVIHKAGWSKGKLNIQLPAVETTKTESFTFTHRMQASGGTTGGMAYELTLGHEGSDSVIKASRRGDVFDAEESGELELELRFDRFPYYIFTRIMDKDAAKEAPKLTSAYLTGNLEIGIHPKEGWGSYQLSYSNVKATEDKRSFLKRMLPGGSAAKLNELADEDGNTPEVRASWKTDWEYPSLLVILAEFQKAGTKD